MKILHISANSFTVKNLLIPQVDYFLKQGLDVEIGCALGAETDKLQGQGYKFREVKINRKINPIANWVDILRLTRVLRRHRYDLVHVHTPVAAFVARIAARLAGVKRVVYTAHGFPFHERSPRFTYWLYFNLEKSAAPFTDVILTQSYEDFLTAKNRGLCAPNKVRHLGNGIDIDRFSRTELSPQHQLELRRSLKIPDSAEFVVGTIGRLTHKKGSGYLVEAIAELLPEFPNLHAVIIGGQVDGDPAPYQANLIQRIQALGLSNYITLTGYRSDTPNLLGLLDIFTLPTFTHEGLPRSILEAMAMELPVVATDIRGCREAVVPAETGFIIPPQSSSELTQSLRLLLKNPEMRASFGKAARQRVEAQFDERHVFQRLKECYEDLGILPKDQHRDVSLKRSYSL